jgi:hypothetical protein
VLSIETHVMPVKIRPALNREGVELQFKRTAKPLITGKLLMVLRNMC